MRPTLFTAVKEMVTVSLEGRLMEDGMTREVWVGGRTVGGRT